MTTSPDTPSTGAAAAPLTHEDFDVLDRELDLMREVDDETPQWEFCEGFMAALIKG